MLKMGVREEDRTLDDANHRSRATSEAQSHDELRRDLVRAVRRVCPRSLAADAEDLVQEAFIRLLRARKLGSESTLSPAYLKKVAYSAVIDEIRRRRRRVAVDPVTDDTLESAAEDRAVAAPDTSLGNAMELCLQRLEPDRKRAVTLHLLGYSGSEIAHILGCNMKRADNLTHRGLAQLREYLHDMGLSP